MPVADDVVTYRLRIDLSGTEPPLWRELEVVSDLFLDELHWIIQVAFGREDRHLNQFTAQPGRNRREGIPEEEVRLDEVLVRPGDKLLLRYAGPTSSRWRRSCTDQHPCRTPDAWLASLTGGAG